MKQTFSAILLSASIFALAGVAHAAFSETDWQYIRSISAGGSGSFGKIILPADISRSANNFSDVRIVNQNGIETPYLITKNIQETGARTSARLVNVSSRAGETVFVADAGQNGTIHTGIDIAITSASFRRQVTIYTASSLLDIESNQWAFVTNKAYIFKFTDPQAGFVSGKSTVSFGPSSARYIKVVIGAGEEGPVSVSGATLYGDTRIEIPVNYQTVTTSVFNNPKKRTSEITLDLGRSGILTNAVTLTIGDQNYNRRVLVEASDSDTASSTWMYVGAGSISNISTGLFTGTSNRIAFSEQKKRYLRLSIVNDDNRVLSVGNGATVESPVISAVFEKRQGETYSLYYGNPQAITPTYDINAISSYIQLKEISVSTLDDERVNPSYVAPAGPVIPFTEANKWLLNGVLVVVVLIFGAGIMWYLRTYIKKS
ncbi:MAG: hypothetical protein RIT04_52 [Candidatus Parcubacteria bacterium]|jgi:hypothetical protein